MKAFRRLFIEGHTQCRHESRSGRNSKASGGTHGYKQHTALEDD